jgi:hypothetical protein
LSIAFREPCGFPHAERIGYAVVRINHGRAMEVEAKIRLRLPDFRSSPFGLRYGFGYAHHHKNDDHHSKLEIHFKLIPAVRINWKLG